MSKSQRSGRVRAVWEEVAARAGPLGLACSLLAGGAIGCAGAIRPPPMATRPAPVPVRDEVQAAAEKAWDGLETLDAACGREIRADTADSRYGDGTTLSQRCLAVEQPAETDRRLLVATLTSWRPESASRVGCYVSGILDAYRGLLEALAPRGYVASPKVEEGRLSATWIASLSGRRGGRCGGS